MLPEVAEAMPDRVPPPRGILTPDDDAALVSRSPFPAQGILRFRARSSTRCVWVPNQSQVRRRIIRGMARGTSARREAHPRWSERQSVTRATQTTWLFGPPSQPKPMAAGPAGRGPGRVGRAGPSAVASRRADGRGPVGPGSPEPTPTDRPADRPPAFTADRPADPTGARRGDVGRVPAGGGPGRGTGESLRQLSTKRHAPVFPCVRGCAVVAGPPMQEPGEGRKIGPRGSVGLRHAAVRREIRRHFANVEPNGRALSPFFLPSRVGLGGFPPRPPTDPDVRVEDASGSSRRRFAVPHTIRPPCGVTLRGPMPSAWFRPSVYNAAPPSLHGVREGPFPRFHATMRRCDSLTSISPHFVAFAWRYHRCVPRSSPTAQDTEPWIGPGVGKPGLQPAFRWRRQGLPSSRGPLVIIRHVL